MVDTFDMCKGVPGNAQAALRLGMSVKSTKRSELATGQFSDLKMVALGASRWWYAIAMVSVTPLGGFPIMQRAFSRAAPLQRQIGAQTLLFGPWTLSLSRCEAS